MKKLCVLLAVLIAVSAANTTPVFASESEEFVSIGKHYCTAMVIEATCEHEGKAVYNCINCGEQIEEVTPKADHSEVVTSSESTFFKKGYKDRVVCSDCGEILEDGTVVKKLKLPKIKITEVKTVGADSVKLTWDKNKDASGYIIYKKQKGAKSFKKVKQVKGENSSTVSGLICGKNYVFGVKAYVAKGGKKVLSSAVCEKGVKIEFNSINKFEIDTKQFCFPTKGKKASITSAYGWRDLGWHSGIDIDGETGDKVMAYKSGVVYKTSYNAYGWGNYVLIYHGKVNGKKIYSGYAHLDSISVKKGDEVVQGQKIGELGNTGRSYGSHLHFEIYKGGTNPSEHRVNPTPYLGIKNEKGWQTVR